MFDEIVSSRPTAWLLVGVNVAVGVYAFTQRFGYADVLLLYLAETVAIGAKTAVDLRAHLAERRRFRYPASPKPTSL
jgi:hypothetical protein